jgi:hypothetical protein
VCVLSGFCRICVVLVLCLAIALLNWHVNERGLNLIEVLFTIAYFVIGSPAVD